MRTGLTDWTRGLNSAKLLIIAFQYRIHLLWNHLTHLVKITGIAMLLNLALHRTTVCLNKVKTNFSFKQGIFDTAVS